jgi:hypothetical protein
MLNVLLELYLYKLNDLYTLMEMLIKQLNIEILHHILIQIHKVFQSLEYFIIEL